MSERSHYEFFKGKFFAGPMMKVSNLPFRLMCLENGADGVFGPAINCEMLLASNIKDDIFYLGNPSKNEILFRTSPEERGKLIFQLFANDSSKAVEAVRKIYQYASAVDINCGCPSNFATSKGQGNAMFETPELMHDIVSKLRGNFPNFPVSVKFRINENLEKSIQFAKVCELSGASAITLHGRLAENRHKGEVKYDEMKIVFGEVNGQIGKIGNGGITSREEGIQLMEKIKCDSVMISSAALRNPKLFSNHFIQNNCDVIQNARDFIQICQKLNCPMNEFRFYLLEMLNKYSGVSSCVGFRRLNNAKSLQAISDILNDDQYF
ncbi:dihydrouridine synthase [Tritrichomonas foetus]|uniref:tRNA-dihydrouridine synthase n=1 Tax=Tritrichomonas foetus TaxID=1144522 RepID=A0A1J4JM35_9EUKA|nr:dihydrouridine synthase [Tritrichomonas foetus]|eukprot:OHS99753.1 dihydrouridine synthase [Tritrichomonas foetus]